MFLDYSVLIFGGNDSNPILAYDGESPDFSVSKTFVENPELVTYRYRDPIPRKPELVDYHAEFQPAISKKLFEVLSPLNISGIQLIPAVIRDKKRSIEHSHYWQLLIYNYLTCVDLEKSECRVQVKFGENRISKVKSLVLDQKVLDTIPLRERLIFRLTEQVSYKLFHNSIVEKIMAVEPKGLRFVPINDWNSNAY